MFEDLFGELETSLTSFVESQVFQIGVRVLVIYIVLIWLASAFWAYRDMRLRSASAITPYIAAATIIVFTPIFFLFGLLVYRIIRPKETIAEVNERALAEEAMLAEVATHAQCANCSRPVHEDWIICPSCRNRLRRVCPNCEHLIELDWTLCAWCGKDFERADTPGTTPAFMPSARPAPRLQANTQRRPAPTPSTPSPTSSAPSRPLPPPPARSSNEGNKPNPAPATPKAASAATSSPPQGSPGSATSSNPAPRSSGASSAGSPAGSSRAGGATPASGTSPTTGI